jgi:hypothetical protein
MRRLVTGLLVLGLLFLGLAAAVDALRGEPDRKPTVAAAAGTGEEEATPVAALRAAGVHGTLVYSDEQCRLHVRSLPELVPLDPPHYTSCEPHIPSGGLGVLDGEVVWSGLGFEAVQVVLSGADLAAAVRRDPQAWQLAYGGRGPYRARQVVALGGDRFAVVLVNPRADWEALLGIFSGRRLVHLEVRAVGLRDVIRPSPHGRYLAVVHPQGVDIRRADGRQLTEPSVTNPHAVAWSPDDRWTALVTRYSVYVFPSERPGETIRIPLAGVRDLDWGT